MRDNPQVHDRRSVRLPAYDYTQAGAYFVTICTYDRECIFEDPAIEILLQQIWARTVGRGRYPEKDEFVVMPNHVHGIVWITAEPTVESRTLVGVEQLQCMEAEECFDLVRGSPAESAVAQPLRPDPAPIRRGLRDGLEPGSLFVLVRTFKSAVAKRINNRRGTRGSPIWQGDYYEHIIRDEDDLRRIREYILDNPRKWTEDPDNPAAFKNHGGTGNIRRG
jgi:REP element-mobilizing transposase RayT